MSRGRPPKVDHIRNGFIYQISVARNLETAVQRLAAIHPGAGPHLHPKHVFRSVELAFMGVCAAWEDFLEATMIRYLAGAKTNSGYEPNLRVGPCQGILHAYQLISGKPDYDPENQFLPWTNPTSAVKLAAVLFAAGAPYKAPMQREADRLKQAAKIRNRVAHASEKCKSDFKEAANAILQRNSMTPLGQGFRAGELLSTKAGAFFGAGVPALNISIFEAYMRSFDKLAKEIVPL